MGYPVSPVGNLNSVPRDHLHTPGQDLVAAPGVDQNHGLIDAFNPAPAPEFDNQENNQNHQLNENNLNNNDTNAVNHAHNGHEDGTAQFNHTGEQAENAGNLVRMGQEHGNVVQDFGFGQTGRGGQGVNWPGGGGAAAGMQWGAHHGFAGLTGLQNA